MNVYLKDFLDLKSFGWRFPQIYSTDSVILLTMHYAPVKNCEQTVLHFCHRLLNKAIMSTGENVGFTLWFIRLSFLSARFIVIVWIEMHTRPYNSCGCITSVFASQMSLSRKEGLVSRLVSLTCLVVIRWLVVWTCSALWRISIWSLAC